MATSGKNGAAAASDDEEDDYMNMTFSEPAQITESSVQRAQRLKQESRARGIIKSKAQIAEEEAAAREKALSTSMLDDPRAKKSKGLAMMAKMGFSGGGLGKKAEDGASEGRTEPITVAMKEDRGGVGLEGEKKRKFKEAMEAAGDSGVKAVKLDPLEYRDRIRKERESERLEKQFFAAQRMAENMDEEQASDAMASSSGGEENATTKTSNAPSTRPLKSISVLYRGLIRHRLEKERDRRMRHDLEQSLSRLPTYEDDDEDKDDKKAMGKSDTVCAEIEDLDEEDEELEAFNALDIEERLRQVLVYLRGQHQYCVWCKMGYPDKELEGCPGLTEEEHD